MSLARLLDDSFGIPNYLARLLGLATTGQTDEMIKSRGQTDWVWVHLNVMRLVDEAG